ncbi:SGNH/GDSL hydrolase family protein [Brachyspira sp.]|uniref:SGNH/GDSL hydrolase family protein n=1 Tax=Brachyspira sp. TaxID=1977261 RepID=UPI0026316E30|nr:SGNH/GDSL hydrolase family protein [Brachyspira sp.]
MINILCYGDSNTFGFVPVIMERYAVNERWTGILQYILGDKYRIIENGLCGRTTMFNDPCKSSRNGLHSIDATLEISKPLDLVIISLGTNDLKVKYSAPSNTITQGIKRIISAIRNYDYEIKCNVPKILVLAPPPLGDKVESVNNFSEFDKNSISVSKELSSKYKLLSEQENVYFFDLGSIIKSSEEDQIHFTKESHKIVAEHLAEKIKNIFEK